MSQLQEIKMICDALGSKPKAKWCDDGYVLTRFELKDQRWETGSEQVPQVSLTLPVKK